MTTVIPGLCPVCETRTEFRSTDGWFRDHLRCAACDSIPRERAFAWALDRFRPNWRELAIHESSPAPARRVSARLREGCKHYIASQYFPGVASGKIHQGMRCENLESLSFKDASLDLHLHLDVMEHVNRPDLCFREIARTLRAGGAAIFTTPLYAERAASARRAIRFADGDEHLAPPEYHGNPVDDQGALVTFHYGQNFSDLIRAWAPDLSLLRLDLNDARIGVIGEFRDVFIAVKGMI
ncbi:SAM-dependent methyltransferase [Rhodobacteraceae bacterium MBR-64]